MALHAFDRLILHNAAIHTMDDAAAVAPAVGFAGGRVTAVGTLDAVRGATPNAEERDLAGAVVYPGFIDAHHHFCFAATYAAFPEIRCPPCRTLADVLALVAQAAAQTPEGEWIVLVGFNEHNLAERRTPDRHDLDRVAPSHPVLLIHFTYHEGVLNSLGLRAAGLDALRDDPPGGMLGRAAGGAPDGRVYERCFGAAEAVARHGRLAASREGWFAIENAYQERVLAAGITHVCDAAVPASMEALYREWQRRGELHVGVTMMPLGENMFAVPADRLDGAATGWADGRLALGPLKLFTDGGTKCALCITLHDAIRQFAAMLLRTLRHRSLAPWRLALQQPARWGTDRRLHTGLLYYEDEALEAVIRAACARGFSVGIHAGGNVAIRQALAALAAVYRGAALPPRIDHFFFLEEEALRRAVDLGVHVVVQPVQLYDTGPLLRQTGIPPALAYQAHRRMLDAGLTLAASSDAPVFTFDVIAAIDTAVRRCTADGATLGREQAITAAEALRLYTRGGAATLGMGGEIGVLRPGARADAVILSEDPATVPPARLREVGVRRTLAGRVEWR
ncbi:amidohydrolase [bacterium]|nr:amidohydrolase [bacterium]